MNAIFSFFFKSWIRCVLTLVALGAVSMAVQQGMSRRFRPAVQSTSGTPLQETRALPDPAARAEVPQVETPTENTAKEPSSVLAGTNGVPPVSPAPVPAPAREPVVASPGPGQIIVPPLAHAIKAPSNIATVGVGPSGSSEAPTVDPPLAFIVDPKNLTPEQQTKLAMIQDQFLKAVGNADQSPIDPAYGARWMTAQSIADQNYRAFFGWSAFEQMQLERAMNSYTGIQLP